MEEIAPGVYVSSFYPGINVGFVVTDDGVIAVDTPPLPADAWAWREHVLKATGSPLRYVVLTDHHLDRLIGVGWLGAPVIAGRGTLRRLQEGGESFWRAAIEEWARLRPDVEGLGRVRPVLPEVTVAGRITLHGSPPVVVEAVAGAAPGSVWVWLPRQEVLFAGDTVVVGVHPPLAETPDSGAWLKTLVRLRRARFPARLIVPGRGPVCGKEATRGLSEYIRCVRRRIRSVHTAGGSRGDLSALVAEFLPLFPAEGEERERMQRRIRASLERVYEELQPEEVGR